MTLKHTGKMPKSSMGHNIVLATTTADANAAAADGMKAGMAADYVKPGDSRVIGYSKMIGGGETTTFDFEVAKLKPGTEYTCSVLLPRALLHHARCAQAGQLSCRRHCCKALCAVGPQGFFLLHAFGHNARIPPPICFHHRPCCTTTPSPSPPFNKTALWCGATRPKRRPWCDPGGDHGDD